MFLTLTGRKKIAVLTAAFVDRWPGRQAVWKAALSVLKLCSCAWRWPVAPARAQQCSVLTLTVCGRPASWPWG